MKFLDVPQSGSYAGFTHSHNRAGQYRRNRRSPVQPIGTGRRAFMRSAFGASSSAWAGLSVSQQAAWTSYAAGHPITDSLGQTVVLTGQQMYVTINAQLVNCGAAMVTAVPSSDTVYSPAPVAITATAGTPTLSVTWAAGDAASYALIAFSPQLSAGRTFTNRFWQAIAAGDGDSPYNGLTAYVAEFGVLSIGRKIFVKVTPVSGLGVTGVPVIASVTIAS